MKILSAELETLLRALTQAWRENRMGDVAKLMAVLARDFGDPV